MNEVSKVGFTTHAQERAREYGLSPDKDYLRSLLAEAVLEPYSRKREAMNFARYGFKGLDVEHYYHEQTRLQFTVKGRTVITVFRKKA